MKTQAEEVVKDEVKADPELVTITLNLPPAAGGAISHAGRMYLSHIPYKVEPSVARDLMEIQNRNMAHEASLHESENKNRRRTGAHL